jgi:hypothetical protein
MASPFDYVKAISETKEKMFLDDQAEKEYIPFIVNKSLSYFVDTVMYANEMNYYNQMPKEWQFEYLRCSINKGKRYGGWVKKDQDSTHLPLVKEYYKYSDEKAKAALSLLTDDDLAIIKQKLFRGGR